MSVAVSGAAGFIGLNILHDLNAIGIDDIIAADPLTDGPKSGNLLIRKFADYFDKDALNKRFARGEFARGGAGRHEGACSARWSTTDVTRSTPTAAAPRPCWMRMGLGMRLRSASSAATY